MMKILAMEEILCVTMQVLRSRSGTAGTGAETAWAASGMVCLAEWERPDGRSKVGC